MKNSEEDFSKVTRVARLTPAMPAAIATIAVWGPQSVDAVEKHLRSPRGTTVILKSGAVRYGLWNPSPEMAAEQVVVCLTNVDCVEIHCHGGNAVCEMIFRDLIASGCVRTESELFPTTEQSEIEREAADDLILATTDRAAAILIDQLNGALEGAIAELFERKLREGRDSIKEHAGELLDWSELGLHLSKPWQVVLAGPPNTGKSSLMNAILGAQRSIVHHEPGTTRDWVEGLTAIDGWPVAISDTAGVRESRDQIESEGVRRSLLRVQEADLVVMVVDSTVGWTETHDEIQQAAKGKRTLIAWNKIDLVPSGVVSRDDAIGVSAVERRGMETLLKAIANALVPCTPPAGAAVPFRARHVQLLRELMLD